MYIELYIARHCHFCSMNYVCLHVHVLVHVRTCTWLTRMMLSDLHTQQADMVMAPIATNVDRDQVMDFSEAFFLEYTAVLVRYMDANANKWRLYLQVTHSLADVAVAAATAAVSCSLVPSKVMLTGTTCIFS